MWQPPEWVIWAAVAAGFTAALIDGVLAILRANTQVGGPYGSGDRQKFMTISMAEIHLESGIPFAALGLSLWVVHTPRRSLGALLRREPQRPLLYRVERIRVADPTQTNEEWSTGRGVIGACMKANQAVYRDYRPIQEDFPEDGPAPSRAAWKKIRDAKRDDGFSQADFVRMVNRYEQVFAYAITDDDGRFIGCLSVDVTPDREAPVRPRIDTPRVRASLNTLANNMRTTAARLAVRP